MSRRRLLLDGGGELPPNAMLQFKTWMKQFREETEGGLCRLCLIPWASERDGSEHVDDAQKWIDSEKDKIAIELCPSITELNAGGCTRETENEKVLRLIGSSHGVFVCGGDQERLMAFFDSHPTYQSLLTTRFHVGLPVAGTSAGTAVMSGLTMITGAKPSDGEHPWDFIESGRVDTRSGLGFARIIVTDQHFVRRCRLNRLISVLIDPSTPEPWHR